jgi:NADPH2:quinone reductase
VKAVLFDENGRAHVAERDMPVVTDRGVLVEVKLAGVNPTDTYHRQRVAEGSDERDRVPGVEVSGTVVEVGVHSRWRVGDAVMGVVLDGGLAQYVSVTDDLLVARPDALDDAEAAATPEVFITAHDALRQSGLRAEETALITGASGNVGMAAVQIANRWGAHVWGGVRSDRGASFVAELGARPARDWGGSQTDVPSDSVDVVIELVGGLHARDNLVALAPRGRMVFVAAQGDEELVLPLKAFKTKRATIIGSTLRRRGHAAKAEAVAAFGEQIVPLLDSRRVLPRVARTFPADRAHEAFDFMSSRGKHGKVLIDLASA